MATAGQVVKAILQEILVQASEADLDAAEIQDTIFAMNNYMTAEAVNGIDLGYTVVSSVSDEVTVPAGALQGIIANVAIAVAPQFDAIVDIALIEKARTGLNAMRKLGITLNPMRMPNTLPVGAGNEGGQSNNDHFFPGPDSAVLTEGNNNILLESDTP